MRFNKSDIIYLLNNSKKYFMNYSESVDVWFFSKIVNVGDLVGPYLIEKLTGKKARKNIFGLKPHYLSVGSILEQATEKSAVWGAGFKSEADSLSCFPSKISLVRGELTKRKLPMDFNPSLGDPALALSRFYSPCNGSNSKKKIGLVLHYSDECFRGIFSSSSDIKIIDVKQDVESFVDDIAGCEYIFSSSLHGLIISDSYQIPNCWIKFNKADRNDEFKYRDYYSIFVETDVPNKPLCIDCDKPVLLNDCLSLCQTRPIEMHVTKILDSFE